MKKIALITITILLIPFIIVSFCIKEEKPIIKPKEKEITYNIRVKKEDNSIIKVPFEEYIVGVLAGEMPAKFELEALKAQAVAARSYVLRQMDQNKNNDYDVTDTVMNQVYLDENQMKEKWKNDYDKYFDKLTKAVKETKYEYLTYEGEVIDALFFSTSSGKTENSEDVFREALPYLRSVDSAWDSEVAPAFQETNTFTLSDFYKNLGLKYQKNLNIKTISKTDSGRNKIVEINGVEMTTTDIRKKLNLKSADFTITKTGDYVNIVTKGYGHGVGMSQYGAQAMALKGYTYDKILKHYYQGVEISKIKV